MHKFINIGIICLIISTVLFINSNANATTLFEDDFSGGLLWDTSDESVYIRDNDFLYIGTDGGYNDWAKKELNIELTNSSYVIFEQRLKLESGGLNYRLPYQLFYFEDDSNARVTYLYDPNPGQWGWSLDGYNGNHENSVPGSGWWTTASANYWAVIKIVMTSGGGELYVKPDDIGRGWYSEEYFLVASATWSHSQVAKVSFEQPWDSVGYILHFAL